MFSSQCREEAVAEYYRLQAKDYHNKYYNGDYQSDTAGKPEIELLRNTFRGLDVLEIACGTGFWTEIAATSANSVVATDVNSLMIKEAGQRLSHLKNVSFKVADAYNIARLKGRFNGLFTVLFWCHIPRQRIREVIMSLNKLLEPGSPVVVIDQMHDSDLRKHKSDIHGNKLAQRRASNRNFTVIKNIPDEAQMLDDLKNISSDVKYSINNSSGYWSVSWRTV